MNCAIWNTPATTTSTATGHYQEFDSPRAGGRYWISGTAISTMGNLAAEEKLRLTTWLCQQRKMGVEVPKISSDQLILAKTYRSLSVPERLATCILFLGDNLKKLSDQLHFSLNEPDKNFYRITAETESEDARDAFELLKMVTDLGYAKGNLYIGGGRFCLTPLGWQEVENLRRKHSSSSQCFVAMWFSDETSEPYENGIAKAILASGYDPLRIDQKQHNNKIDDEIVAEIRRSRFLVADFTCAPKQVRGGVYFEAGFAMGLGLPVIWTCKHTSFDDVHFDTRQYAHIVWKTTDDLYAQLKARIGATIGDGPVFRN